MASYILVAHQLLKSARSLLKCLLFDLPCGSADPKLPSHIFHGLLLPQAERAKFFKVWLLFQRTQCLIQAVYSPQRAFLLLFYRVFLYRLLCNQSRGVSQILGFLFYEVFRGL
jgi:hypothetical protein